jgi:pyridoxamine 5'-phosphate oxidase
MSLWTKCCSLPGLLRGLDARDLDPDPIRQYHRWSAFARRAGCFWSNSVCLSTVTPEGRPAARMMLLKGVDERGFVFYTHYVGRKAGELAGTPYAALTVHWPELVRQVRVEGPVERISAEESDAYFRSRLRDSRLGAWVSKQSTPLESRAAFDHAFEAVKAEYKGREIPRPPHWGGYRVRPECIEFWQGRPARLHDRFRYDRTPAGGWTITRLHP